MRYLLALLLLVGPSFAENWYPGDLHTHSVHSWDAAAIGGDSVARCLRLGVKQGLKFVSITDHQSVAAQHDPEFVSDALTPIPGEEWGIMGHAGIHGTRSVVPEVDTTRPAITWNAQVDRTLMAVRARGSLVVVNHPPHPEIVWAWTTQAFDAVEVWNAGWVFPFPKPTSRATADQLLKDRGLGDVPGAMSRELSSALEVQTGGWNAQSVAFWEAHLARGAHAAAVGGGDRHILIAPGYPTTWIQAPDRKLRTLLDAVRAGRTCVTRSPEVGPAELTLTCDGATARPGDVVSGGKPVMLTVRASVRGRGMVVFYRGRQAFAQVRVDASHPVAGISDLPAGPTWYRAEVLEPALGIPLPAGQAASGFSAPAIAGGAWSWPALRSRHGPLASLAGTGQPEDMLAFLKKHGEKIDDEGRLPSFRLPDPINRAINLDPTHRGWCKSALTSPIYVR